MEGETLDMAMRIKPPVATSVGLWVGYRGYGGGYSLSMSGNKGINMSFNMSSPNNGINIRYRRFKFDEPECEMVFTSGQSIETASFDGKALGTPMDFESFVFDGYWLFNKKVRIFTSRLRPVYASAAVGGFVHCRADVLHSEV